MTYKEICREMLNAGWGSHAVLCLKGIDDPLYDRKGSGFCTVGSIKHLDTYALYQRMGRAPDLSDEPGEPVGFEYYEPRKGGTKHYRLKAWVYRDKELVEFSNPEGRHMICALSDVERKLLV